MKKIVNASDVKPNFDNVKQIWKDLLNKYFDTNGNLSSEYILDVSCPHCFQNDFDIEESFLLNGFHHHECKNCNCLYVSPRLKDNCLTEIYSDEYYSEMFQKSMIPFFEKRKRLIGEPKYRQILSHMDISSNKDYAVLDVGCGIGEVLDVFKDQGWDCNAVELNKVAVKWLKEKGINVFNDNFENYHSEKKFDVVMAWNVIEHVVNPQEFLSKAYSLLKPGGIFISEVPHSESLLVDFCRRTGADPKRILQGEQHIILYSRKAYHALHSKAGFDLIALQTNGLDVSTISSIKDIDIDESSMIAFQESIDKKLFGDLLRGIWRK